MIRRQFLERMARVGGAGLVAIETGCSRERSVVTFAVDGFTCVTCATGLETLLERERGVVAVAATYSQARARVVFDPSATDAEQIAAAIHTLGFAATVYRVERRSMRSA